MSLTVAVVLLVVAMFLAGQADTLDARGAPSHCRVPSVGGQMKRRTNWVRAISDIMIGLALIASMVLIASEFPDPTLWEASAAALVAVAFCAHLVPILARLAKS